MGFWKRLFKGKNEELSDKLSRNKLSRSDQKLELQEKRIAAQFLSLLKPKIRRATKLKLEPASSTPENSQLLSHFGGMPYFESGEKWPASKNGKPLSFIFQIYNAEGIELPDDIRLVQFYYDWDECPWDTANDGWLVKIYKSIDEQSMIQIKEPEIMQQPKFCEIRFNADYSLPDWEGIDLYDENVSAIAIDAGERHWELYEQAVSQLTGPQDFKSQIGGYPTWVQGESTPIGANGKPMRLLFQIDSEEAANLMWGDSGLIYVFYDNTTEKIEFMLQCY